MRCRRRPTSLPAPYLKRLWRDRSLVPDPSAYPFCLPLFHAEFALAVDLPRDHHRGRERDRQIDAFDGIATMAGYDDAGGGKGCRTVDHSIAIEATGGRLALARLEETEQLRLTREFCADPPGVRRRGAGGRPMNGAKRSKCLSRSS